MNMSLARISMTFVTFIVGWVAMMGAMMFPAIVPVVMTFRRAAVRRQVASTPMLIAGYLMGWSGSRRWFAAQRPTLAVSLTMPHLWSFAPV
jgi:predicted metal-binding membrane protein